MSDDVTQIRDLIERWADAVHAGDLETVVADRPTQGRRALDRGSRASLVSTEERS
jgi:hypothetical protein